MLGWVIFYKMVGDLGRSIKLNAELGLSVYNLWYWSQTYLQQYLKRAMLSVIPDIKISRNELRHTLMFNRKWIVQNLTIKQHSKWFLEDTCNTLLSAVLFKQQKRGKTKHKQGTKKIRYITFCKNGTPGCNSSSYRAVIYQQAGLLQQKGKPSTCFKAVCDFFFFFLLSGPINNIIKKSLMPTASLTFGLF